MKKDSDVNLIRVALAGNPNAGKTSIFNAVTGAHHQVGNYPGVTVENGKVHGSEMVANIASLICLAYTA